MGKLLDAYRRRAADSDDLSALRGAFLADALYRIPATRLAQAQAGGGRAYHYLLVDSASH
jgi:para-nitrobenzyl esterase